VAGATSIDDCLVLFYSSSFCGHLCAL